jgi:hypothetical protein
MSNGKHGILRIIVLMVTFSLLITGPVTAGMTMKHGEGMGHGMVMHHQHIMLNHALGMVVEGSNMTMFGQMGIAKGIDDVSVDHGMMMMKNGRSLWNELMSGQTMTKMHGMGTSPTDDPMMAHTHKLAEAQVKVMDLLSKMSSSSMKGHGMAMHHQHIMLNHALKMAVEGSNMLMLGQMGMAKGIDDISVDHGKMMMKHAKTLFNETMSGEAMMEMHGGGVSPEADEHMAETHKLAEAILKVMNMLKMMPTVSE